MVFLVRGIWLSVWRRDFADMAKIYGRTKIWSGQKMDILGSRDCTCREQIFAPAAAYAWALALIANSYLLWGIFELLDWIIKLKRSTLLIVHASASQRLIMTMESGSHVPLFHCRSYLSQRHKLFNPNLKPNPNPRSLIIRIVFHWALASLINRQTNYLELVKVNRWRLNVWKQ